MSEAPLICTVAIELSRSRWMFGVLPPRSTKVAVSAVAGGDTGRLLVQLHQLQERLAREFEQPVEIKICFEAGYDGFWLARFLRDRGHDVYVLDASSFLISRRGRRTKTDRVDVAAMTFTLRAVSNTDRPLGRLAPQGARRGLTRTLATWRPDMTSFREAEAAYRIALKSLARRYLELHDEIADLDTMIASGTPSSAAIASNVLPLALSARAASMSNAMTCLCSRAGCESYRNSYAMK